MTKVGVNGHKLYGDLRLVQGRHISGDYHAVKCSGCDLEFASYAAWTEHECSRFHVAGGVKEVAPKLPTDGKARKAVPMFSGLMRYFPLALAEVAKLSKAGNDQHNPGQPLHWSRDKSSDHTDCVIRHMVDYALADTLSERIEAMRAVAWRALAQLQLDKEEASANYGGPVK